MASKAIPSHLRQAASNTLGPNGSANSGIDRKHHGKSQSHVVSASFILHTFRGPLQTQRLVTCRGDGARKFNASVRLAPPNCSEHWPSSCDASVFVITIHFERKGATGEQPSWGLCINPSPPTKSTTNNLELLPWRTTFLKYAHMSVGDFLEYHVNEYLCLGFRKHLHQCCRQPDAQRAQ